MASTGARLPSFGHAVVRHNQSLSRNARGWSSGWNPLVGVAGAATRASAFSFIRMSAWMSIWIDRDRLVSEPEGDHCLIDAMMEQVHRGA
jgi:hypothetical protein